MNWWNRLNTGDKIIFVYVLIFIGLAFYTLLSGEVRPQVYLASAVVAIIFSAFPTMSRNKLIGTLVSGIIIYLVLFEIWRRGVYIPYINNDITLEEYRKRDEILSFKFQYWTNIITLLGFAFSVGTLGWRFRESRRKSFASENRL